MSRTCKYVDQLKPIKIDILDMHCSGMSVYEISCTTKVPAIEIKIIISKFERFLERIRCNAVPVRTLSENELRIIIEEAISKNFKAIDVMVRQQIDRKMENEIKNIKNIKEAQKEIISMMKSIDDEEEKKEMEELLEM